MADRSDPRSGVGVRVVDVVLVDDDEDLRELLTSHLRALGYAVRPAADVDEALGQIAQCVPDVVVTDLHLGPGLTGWALASAVREHPPTAHVPLLAITGSNAQASELLQAFDSFLRKPFDLEALEDALREHVERAAPRRATGSGRG